MTNSQAQIEFKIRYDKVDSLNYPNFTIVEIDSILNQAYQRIVKQRYGINNTKRQSFEETQKRDDDLKALVQNAMLTPLVYSSNNIDVNANFVILPTDYWFIVQERADLNYQECDNNYVTKRIDVYPASHYDINKFLFNPFKKPSITRILRLMENNQVELIHAPNTNIVSYYLRYIKKPLIIDTINSPNTNLEASDHLQSEIIDEAVKIAIENIEGKRIQTFEQIKNTNE